MKAFVHRQDEDGNDRLGTGVHAGMVSPEYRDYANLKRWFLSRLPPGRYHVEAFFNWDHRYGKPDLDVVYVVEPVKTPKIHKPDEVRVMANDPGEHNVSQPKFALGEVVATPNCLTALRRAGQTVEEFLVSHQRGDWGDVSPGDGALNDTALLEGSRLFSAYLLKSGIRIWVITEAVGDDGKRASTCLLLPEEY